jgi:hypothetical protein
VEIFLGKGNLYLCLKNAIACASVKLLEIVCKRLHLLWQSVCLYETWRDVEIRGCLSFKN